MTDAILILLAATITSLTVVLVIIGIEFFMILKEMKKSIEKVNTIIEDTHTVTHTVASTVEEATTFLDGLKKGASLVKTVRKLARKLNEE